MKIRYTGFSYRGLNNLGDQIQSIGTERFLPEINMRLNRDTLASEHCNPIHLLIMNGWFSHQPEHCLPISNSILTVFGDSISATGMIPGGIFYRKRFWHFSKSMSP
jgi:hypothetical protein